MSDLDARALMGRDARLQLGTYMRAPFVLVRGSGMYVYDEAGNEYLDLSSGLGVNVLGHCAPEIVEAIHRQAQTLIHASNAFYTLPQVELAALLVEHSAFDRVFFTNSGAESNECALKIARAYGARRRGGANEIIVAKTAFHGRTLGTLSATGHSQMRAAFEPLLPGFCAIDYNDSDALERAITPATAAILLEPVEGVNGVHPATPAFLAAARRLADRHRLLLIFDEIQSGLGRTGKLWAYERYGVEPDVMTLAKALGGGLPIGACLVKDEAAVLSLGEHGSTFGGNPVACAAALATLKTILARDLPARAAETAAFLEEGLSSLAADAANGVVAVRGFGLWFGLELAEPRAHDVWYAAAKRGVLLAVSGNRRVLRVLPPLIATRADCQRMLDVLGGVLPARSGAAPP